MINLNAHVKSLVETTACPIHHQKPLLEISDGKIIINCCCSDFKVMCLKQVIRVLIQEKDNTLQVA